MADAPDYVNGEPPPVHNFNPSVHDLLVNDVKHRTLGFSRPCPDYILGQMVDLFRERKAYGLNKYGTPLQAENGRDFVKDGIDEAIDLLAYVRQGLEENPLDVYLKEAYTMGAISLKNLLVFKQNRENGAANGASKVKTSIRCFCESGSECGGTGFKDA